jgi:serine/threonine-protein kinase
MTVAVKALKAEAAGDPDFVQTLLDEARTAMQLSHSQIARMHTLQQTEGFYYLVMEYIEGHTLREWLGTYDCLPLETVGQIVSACHPPLNHAHKRGILHNDIKPDNLLLCSSGIVKFLDFGLSCLANQPPESQALLGTPAYMSPERLGREVLDLRSDIYSLGLTAHELLTGRLPFPEGLTPDDYLEMESVEMPLLEGELRFVLEKACARDRRRRWETLDDFIAAFEAQVPAEP